MQVFIVLDLEASPKDCVWSVNSTMEKALDSQKELIESSVDKGLITSIITETIY